MRVRSYAVREADFRNYSLFIIHYSLIDLDRVLDSKMETHETTYIDSYETRVKKPGAGETALVTDYGTLDHYLEICKKNYEERRADFFDSVVET